MPAGAAAGSPPAAPSTSPARVDSVGAARTLTVTSDGTTRFGGAVGGSSPLATLTASGGGTTRIDGGSVVTSGTQTYGNAVLLGSAAALNAGTGNIVFSRTIDGPHALAATTTGNATFSGVIGGIDPLHRLEVDARSITLNESATVERRSRQRHRSAGDPEHLHQLQLSSCRTRC